MTTWIWFFVEVNNNIIKFSSWHNSSYLSGAVNCLIFFLYAKISSRSSHILQWLCKTSLSIPHAQTCQTYKVLPPPFFFFFLVICLPESSVLLLQWSLLLCCRPTFLHLPFPVTWRWPLVLYFIAAPVSWVPHLGFWFLVFSLTLVEYTLSSFMKKVLPSPPLVCLAKEFPD